MSTLNYELIQQQAKCNWCRNPMIMSEPITEANFVDTGKKYPALYCSSCLAIEFRKSQPKSCINPETLDEINIEDLPDKGKEQGNEQPTTTAGGQTTEKTEIQKGEETAATV